MLPILHQLKSIPLAISRRLSGQSTLSRRLCCEESGSIVVLLAAVPVIIGVVAVGIETGQLYRMKRQMQISADAAAMAGSVDRVSGMSATLITSDAQYEAQRNGFTNGSNGVVVTVNSPPTSGPNVGTTGAVEVIVTKQTKFSLGGVLMNWLGHSNSNFTMRARAVAAALRTARHRVESQRRRPQTPRRPRTRSRSWSKGTPGYADLLIELQLKRFRAPPRPSTSVAWHARPGFFWWAGIRREQSR